MSDETKAFVCECGYRDHAFAFHYEAEDRTLLLTVRMTQERAWWQRLRTAVRYVFNGTPCRFGDWCESYITFSDAEQIRVLVDRFRGGREAWADDVVRKAVP